MINFFFIVTSLLWLLSNPPRAHKSTKQVTLKISITNIKKVKGNVLVSVYENAESFLSRKSFKDIAITPKTTSCKSTIKLQANKEYAIAVLQDFNDNGKMDKNLFGIPKEPFGISGVQKKTLKKPTFKDAAFFLDKNMSISINLIHY